MSELKNNNPKPNSAKKTVVGLIIFAVVCACITYVCIFLTLEERKQSVQTNFEANIVDTKEAEDKGKKVKNKYQTLKLTDKAYLNGITENVEKESYGEIVDHFSYDNSFVKKLEIEYAQISGLKDRNVQATINQAIKDKVDELKAENFSKIDDNDVDRISITASLYGNFSDVISINIYVYTHYDYDDADYENDTYDNQEYGLNFSLIDGSQIKFNDIFWEDSPLKTIISQSAYKQFAWDYAFAQEESEWDWNMDNLDYSQIESKVYNLMYKYNKNPDIEFYFTASKIFIPYSKTTTIPIEMADFYEYIALYTKYKSSSNLYEDDAKQKEFYVFANYVQADDNSVIEKGKRADNVYYIVEGYDDVNNLSEDGKKACKVAYNAIIKQVNEYAKQFKNDSENGYIIEGFYMVNDNSEYNESCGYNIHLEVANCSRKYFDEHLEDALAAGARKPRVDIAPTNYAYIDEDNFEFYETYSEWANNYLDETTFETNRYTKADKEKDEAEWENYDNQTAENVENIENP